MASPYFIPLLLVLLALPATATDICEPERDVKTAPQGSTLVLKLVAIASILFSGSLGVLIPILGRSLPALQPDRDAFFVVKAFAAGVILATGLVHILPDAFQSLTSPCLPERPWRRFPLAGFAAMASAMATLVIDTLATSYYRRSHLSKATPADVEVGGGETGDGTGAGAMHVHTHASHGHAHGSAAADGEPGGISERIRHRVVAQVLELGIVVHSVIIGISLGASYNKDTIRPLLGALSFHQFFEGMGLGGCIVQARFRANSVAAMTLFFSLTTPLGIVAGIGISSFYDERSPKALAVEGLLNAASAGILIYMSLVDLLAADFASAKMQTSGKLQFWSYCALFLGAGPMSLVAVWA